MHRDNVGLRPTSEAYTLIRSFEGLRLQAYLDSVGVPTIGYGTTSAAGVGQIKLGMRISRATAEDWLVKTIEKLYLPGVLSAVNVPLNANQLGALVSFVYNVGVGALQKSTLLKLLNKGNYDAVPGQLARFTHSANPANKKGLLRRRTAEAALWLKPVHATRREAVASAADAIAASGSTSAVDEDFDPVAGDTAVTALVGEVIADGAKPVSRSTTVQGAAAAAVGVVGAVTEASKTVPAEGMWFVGLMCAVALAGLALVVYNRLYKDQPPLA